MKGLSKRALVSQSETERSSKETTAQSERTPTLPIGPSAPTVRTPWVSYPEGDAGYMVDPQPGGGIGGSPFDSMSGVARVLPLRLNDEDRIYMELFDKASSSTKGDFYKTVEVYRRAYPFINERTWRNLLRRLLPLIGGLSKEADAKTAFRCPQCGTSFSLDELKSGGEFAPRGGLCPVCRLGYGG